MSRYVGNLEQLLEVATFKERKELLRQLVEGIELAPEGLTVEVVYRAPGPLVLNRVVAGVLYEAQQRYSERRTEVVELRFTTRGTALVPVGAAVGEDGAIRSAVGGI